MAALTSLGAPWGTSRFHCVTAVAEPEILEKLQASSPDPWALNGHRQAVISILNVEPGIFERPVQFQPIRTGTFLANLCDLLAASMNLG